jgi:hypothetical protein
MSPELLDPESKIHLRTKHSDCYALGMVIYEVLSRRIPFYRYTDFVVFGKVVKGERPEKPQGSEGAVGFVDDVWEVLELCWASLPQDRPSIEGVLERLEKAASSWTPPSPLSPAVSSVANSSTWGTSDTTSEQCMDVDKAEDASPSPSQPSGKLPLKGGADDNSIAHVSSALPHESPDHHISRQQSIHSQITDSTVRMFRFVSTCCTDDLHFSPVCAGLTAPLS